METKLLDSNNYVSLMNDCVDVYGKDLFKLIPFGKKLLANEQTQPANLWLKTNCIQIQSGSELTLRELKPVKILELTTDSTELIVLEELSEYLSKQEAWLKRRLESSISELMLNYEQHLRDLLVPARIILAESEHIVLIGLDDDLGKFNLALMNKYGLKDYAKENYVSDDSKVGGGLGVYSMIKRGSLFYGQCNWKKKSKTYVGFLKDKNSKDKTIFLEEIFDGSINKKQ